MNRKKKDTSNLIDKLIAMEVMGYTLNGSPFPGPGFWVTDVPYAPKNNPQNMGYILDNEHKLEYADMRIMKIWSPSNIISQAWQIVEKIKTDGLAILVSGEDNSLWSCSIRDMGKSTWQIDEHHTKAPMAICLAALKAKGITFPDRTKGEERWDHKG